MMGQMFPGWLPAAPKHTMQKTMPRVTPLNPARASPMSVASELLLRYPGSEEVRGVTLTGVVLMLAAGMLIGFLTPAMANHSPNVHKGYDLYSAALPGVLLGLFQKENPVVRK